MVSRDATGTCTIYCVLHLLYEYYIQTVPYIVHENVAMERAHDDKVAMQTFTFRAVL